MFESDMYFPAEKIQMLSFIKTGNMYKSIKIPPVYLGKTNIV